MFTSKVTQRSAPTLLLLRNVDRLGRNREGKADLRVEDFLGSVVQELSTGRWRVQISRTSFGPFLTAILPGT